MWNQNEFCLKLLSLHPANSWTAAECTYSQWSLCGISITGIAEILGQPGQVPPAPAAASQPPRAEIDEVDYSFFEDSSLFGQGAASSFMGMAPAAGSEQPVFASDEEGDVFKDEDFLDPDILSDHGMLDSNECTEAADGMPLDSSEPSKANRAPPTTSTDTDLLQATLGARCLGNYVSFCGNQYQ